MCACGLVQRRNAVLAVRIRCGYTAAALRIHCGPAALAVRIHCGRCADSLR